MANLVVYSFDGTLDLRQSQSSPGSPQTAQVYGRFLVDYDVVYPGGTGIQADIFVNGNKLDQTTISQSLNQNGILGTRIFSTGSQSVASPFSSSLDLVFTGRAPSTFSSAYLQTITVDYANYTGPIPSAVFDSQRLAVVATPVCFTTGTLIRTALGEVAVEDLRVGDLAVTTSGTLRPITWIGHREMTAADAALPFHQQPVRVRAGAFGHGLPARALTLSPGHPVLVGANADNEGGVLVPIMCLINGTTITREPVASVTYWHVELDAHDILLAEGLPAESYIDGGDRAFFVEASDHALHNPDFVPAGWNARCLPVAVGGPVVDAERQRLDAVFAGALSEQCGWEAAQQFEGLYAFDAQPVTGAH